MTNPAPVIDTRTSLLIAEKGRFFSYTPAATGSPTYWTAAPLPAGLSINSSTGVISGTPTESGVFGIILRAYNYVSRVFTADASANTLLINGHPYENGDIVTATSTTTLPAPLTGDEYEVRDADGTSLKLAATAGGAAVDLTNTGTGTHTLRKAQFDEMSIYMPIKESNSTVDADDSALEINVNVVTGEVKVLGMEGYVMGPPTSLVPKSLYSRAKLPLKSNDRFPVLVGFERNGRLQDTSPSRIVIGLQEFSGEPSIELSEGGFTKVGTGTNTRHRGIINVSRAAVDAILSNYTSDTGTYADMLTEIAWTLPTILPLQELSANSVFSVEGGHGVGEEYEGTLLFPGLYPFSEAIEFTLEVTLTISGRSSQSCLVTVVFNIIWTGTAFLVSEIDSNSPDAGTSDGTNWIVSAFEIIDPVGTADGLSVGYKVRTSNDTAIPNKYVDISAGYVLTNPELEEASAVTLGTGYELELWPGNDEYGDTMIGNWVPGTFTFDNAADAAASILAGWETASGGNDVASVVVQSYSPLTFRVNLESSSAVTHIRWAAPPGGAFTAISPANVAGVPRTATVAASLEQVDEWTSASYERSSETFITRLMDQINLEP